LPRFGIFSSVLTTSSRSAPFRGRQCAQNPAPSYGSWQGAGLALATLLFLQACSQRAKLEEHALASAAPLQVTAVPPEPTAEELPLDVIERVPVPPADGPTLAPLKFASPVYGRPDKQAEKIGYLRIGARLARSEEPVSARGCAGGWYAVRPAGFVCSGDDSTLSLEHPIARAMDIEPDRSRPLPYSYAFAQAVAPNYMRVPSKAEQFESEVGLNHHLRMWRKGNEQWDTLALGANDIPLGPEGLAVGPAPEHAPVLDVAIRFGSRGNDAVPWWLIGDRRIPNLAPFDVPRQALIAEQVQPHAGVALIGSFVADEAAQSRRFAVTTDGRLLPTDKLKPEPGSPFHGQDLRETGLPVAFGNRTTAKFWSIEQERGTPGAPLSRREFVPLTGVERMLETHKMLQARDGRWLRSEDLRVVARPRELPRFATQNRRWIDVSVENQVLVLWQGDRPVYTTLVSTGRDGLQDPKTTLSTPLGTFRILQKHITTSMDSKAADSEFELRDVPWVMYFKGGYALHGAYWHDDFGRARSHGCVNLAPIDARFVFEWSSPDVPEHWHGAYASTSLGDGTLLRIGR
jgi:L,D-transpeptidase-like protein